MIRRISVFALFCVSATPSLAQVQPPLSVYNTANSPSNPLFRGNLGVLGSEATIEPAPATREPQPLRASDLYPAAGLQQDPMRPPKLPRWAVDTTSLPTPEEIIAEKRAKGFCTEGDRGAVLTTQQVKSIKSNKKFWLATAAMVGSAIVSAEASKRCSRFGNCAMGNPLTGRHPIRAKTYLVRAQAASSLAYLTYWFKTQDAAQSLEYGDRCGGTVRLASRRAPMQRWHWIPIGTTAFFGALSAAHMRQ